MAFPDTLQINAFSGIPGSTDSKVHDKVGRWIGVDISLAPAPLAPAPLANDAEWLNPEVGWGLVLPENIEIAPQERATAIDAPEPIQELLKHRKGVVLRYSNDLPKWAVRRYYEDGVSDSALTGSKRGTARGAVPKYLLIYASAKLIPWEFQYRLNAMSFAGRLDLEGEALENYVAALLCDFKVSEADVRKSVIWAVDHGSADITSLMRHSIAKKLAREIGSDNDDAVKNGLVYIDGKSQSATHSNLIDAISTTKPGLIVTTSHGMTGPLDNVPLMQSQMGLPVDANHAALNLDELLADWNPDGAIWYSHACCSAGSDSKTSYEGLVTDNSSVDRLLKGVAKAGALTAPLPRALLGAKKPARAFVGQVEPTFNWTIQQKETGQLLTNSTVDALYRHLFQPEPLGMALSECHKHGPILNMIHLQAKEKYNLTGEGLDEALACRLMAIDRESLVVIGDPAVAFPSVSSDQ